jgi:hypothetical protein
MVDINKGVKGAAAGKNNGPSDDDLMGLLDKLIAAGGQELSLDRLMWKPESCGKFPVVGYIVSINDMPEADRADNPGWRAFVIRLSEPTYGVSRGGDLTRIAKGSEVVVPANYELATNLARFALDSAVMHELGIGVKGRDDIGGGKKMWRFRVVSTGKTEVRTEAYKLPVPTPEAPQLGAGGVGTGAGEGTQVPQAAAAS